MTFACAGQVTKKGREDKTREGTGFVAGEVRGALSEQEAERGVGYDCNCHEQ